MRTPLAWANLTHDRVRFALFVLGVVFAVVLIFVQLGFRGALLDSQTLVHERLNADLVLVSPNRQALVMRETFPRRRLAQAAAVAGVARADPLYIDNGFGVLRNTAADVSNRTPSRAIRVIGIDPDANLLTLPGLTPSEVEMLKVPGNALYDSKSARDDAHPGATVFGPLTPGVRTELSGGRVNFVGSFALGPDFTTDGAMVVSTETFADLLRRPTTLGAPLADVDLGLVRLEPGADIDAVRAALTTALGRGERDPDVVVLTVPEYVRKEQDFWLSNTPIGFAFGFGMFMGFAVGLVICYQILSGDVADHLSEYATLKALGYANRALAAVVVQESLILAGAGYAAGLAVSVGLYALLGDLTGMPLRMGTDRLVIVLATTVAMCVASALLALGRLMRADPADVF
jgi:putative ABC transport system permease protein